MANVLIFNIKYKIFVAKAVGMRIAFLRASHEQKTQIECA